MALLAEELVEEWLNRQGYFTIRGVKLGVKEMDLLAVRVGPSGLERRQIEVQASSRPVSYISRVPEAVQRKTGRRATSAKVRTDSQLRQGVREWVQKKYDDRKKQRLREMLAAGPWSRELVVHVVKHKQELKFFREAGIKVLRLSDIVDELKNRSGILKAASGADLVDLVSMTIRRRRGHR